MSSSFERSWTSRTLKIACCAPTSVVAPRRSTIRSGVSEPREPSGVIETDVRIVFSIVVVVAADVDAMASQHVELVAQLLGVRAEDVAGVRVACDEPQRLALAAAADEDRRVGPAQDLGAVHHAAHADVVGPRTVPRSHARPASPRARRAGRPRASRTGPVAAASGSRAPATPPRSRRPRCRTRPVRPTARRAS